MEIREHNGVGDKQLRKPFYYARWFCCTNKSCKTTLVMPEQYKVKNPAESSDRWSGGNIEEDALVVALNALHLAASDHGEEEKASCILEYMTRLAGHVLDKAKWRGVELTPDTRAGLSNVKNAIPREHRSRRLGAPAKGGSES
jgi:hypothetical protein